MCDINKSLDKMRSDLFQTLQDRGQRLFHTWIMIARFQKCNINTA